MLLAACCLLQSGTAAPEKPVRRVLIFYELGVTSPAVALVDREIRTALEQRRCLCGLSVLRGSGETMERLGQRRKAHGRNGLSHELHDLQRHIGN